MFDVSQRNTEKNFICLATDIREMRKIPVSAIFARRFVETQTFENISRPACSRLPLAYLIYMVVNQAFATLIFRFHHRYLMQNKLTFL